MKQKFAVLLVIMCFMLSDPTVSYAAEASNMESTKVGESVSVGTGGIEPYYINTANISASFRIEGNRAYCLAEVIAKKVCDIQIIMQLQHKENGSWVNKVSWVTSGTAGSRTSSQSYDIFEKGSYRVHVIATVGGEKVTCNSVTETY